MGDQENQLNQTVSDQLLDAAREAGKNAYAPYSGYHVGAAVLADNGEIFTGCNVENASYGLTNCAERTAIFKAVSSGVRKIKAIAIAGPVGGSPAYPCGACRQVIAEFAEAADMPIYVSTGAESSETYTLAELLPKGFELN